MHKKLFILTGIILTLAFYQVILLEIKYWLKTTDRQATNQQVLTDEQFGIIIPKIDINAKVIPNVDPANKSEYLSALKKGVAHAKGSALPGETGNIFIFAHSTDIPLNVLRYNAIFYLLGKLEKGDEIYLTFQDQKYKYIVTSSKIVELSQTEYLRSQNKSKSLTLMTCWPLGTSFKRLLVISEQAA